MFDLWSIIHWAFFAVLASTIAAWKEPPLWVHAAYSLGVGLAWEIAEYFLQRHFTEEWSHRIEPWCNSWVGDPLVDVLGGVFGWFVVAHYRGRWRLL